MKYFVLAALTAASLPYAAIAGEVNGGSVSFGGSALLDGGESTDMTYFGGSVEVGFAPNFAMQADLNRSKLSGDSLVSFGVHAITHMSETTSLGFYTTYDRIGDEGQNTYGLEAGFGQGRFKGETYLGLAQAEGADGTFFGIKGMGKASDNLALGLSHDRYDEDSDSLSNSALRAEYAIENFIVEAQIAQMDVNGTSSEAIFGLGARITFGAERGETFGSRGIANIIPGL